MKEKGRSKFNVSKDKTKRTYKDIVYDSEMEMKYFRDYIEPCLKSGEITSCERQVKYLLIPPFEHKGKKYRAVVYKSDYNLTYKDGTKWVVDVKGMLKPEDIIKEKLLLTKYPDINFRMVGLSKIDSDGNDGGFVDIDKIKQGRKTRKKLKRI